MKSQLIFPPARFLTQVCFKLVLIKGLVLSTVFAMPANPQVFSDTQPDGAEVTLRVKGDENFHWLVDQDGYAVVRVGNGYNYARLDSLGKLSSTPNRVGHVNPADIGLKKGIVPDIPRYKKFGTILEPFNTLVGDSQGNESKGTIKNLVVMIRFSDHRGRTLPSKEDIEILFNRSGGDDLLAPTGSVRDVYLENSYGQLTLDSDVTEWVDVPHSEQYYSDGVSGAGVKLSVALREALTLVDQTVDFRNYHSVSFVHSGYAAEWGGSDVDGTYFANRIWSHFSNKIFSNKAWSSWWFSPQTWVSNEGVSISSYHIFSALWGTSGSSIGRVGVITHGAGHALGLPDLYDVDGGGAGIGSYGVMANPWGFDGSQLYPPHFSPWSKIKLGWITPTVIDNDGVYSLNASELNAEVFRVDQNFLSGEYLLIENRQPAGFDSDMPQGGLAIWHIDERAGYTEGYPGQVGWPNNGKHYGIALLQADGQYDLEKANNQGDGGDVFHADGMDSLDPGSFGTNPNTDAYQYGNIIDTGHSINNISASGSSMSFCFGYCPLQAPSNLSALPTSASSIDLSWSDNSMDEDGFELERSLDGINWSPLVSVGDNVTNYSDTGLNPATKYHYQVRARQGALTSDYSNSSNTTTNALSSFIDYFAVGEDHTFGGVRRNYRQTRTDDNRTQVIIEKNSAGTRASRYDYLEHRWSFNITAGARVTLFANAWVGGRFLGDNFDFEYSIDGITYLPAFIVSSKSSDNVQSAVLTAGINGTVYIRVKDTDRTPGQFKKQRIKIDHLYIRSEN